MQRCSVLLERVAVDSQCLWLLCVWVRECVVKTSGVNPGVGKQTPGFRTFLLCGPVLLLCNGGLLSRRMPSTRSS
jgi:hypothetical protein